jgi:hypothetical protein
VRSSWWLALTLCGGSGCRATVPLELPPTPAVALSADRVAVVARERSCQQAADALALELGRSSYLQVDPRSPLRIDLFGCGDDQSVTVEQQAGPEGTDSRTRVETRAHAVVRVADSGRVLAHLIASGRDEGSSTWSQPTSVGRLSRQARNRVHEDLARDVVRQLNPLPVLVERRVYPNAPAGTARDLTTQAVLAERDGDLQRAVELATAAWLEDPNRRTASYLDELKRRTPSP